MSEETVKAQPQGASVTPAPTPEPAAGQPGEVPLQIDLDAQPSVPPAASAPTPASVPDLEINTLDVVRVSQRDEREPGLAEVVASWRAALTAGRGPASSLAGAVESGSWLDLTNAHPSGVAQLLAGRPTRLSSLIRDAGKHLEASKRARAIRAAATTLAVERGVRGCYLAAGIVSWGTGGKAVSAPLLLRGASLFSRGALGDDLEVHLDDGAVVNAELVRAMAVETGVRIDGAELSALAFGQRGFDPRPVYDWLESQCAGLEGFHLERHLVVATFTTGSGAAVADLDAAVDVLPEHDLLSRIAASAAGVQRARAAGTSTYTGTVALNRTDLGLLPGGRERDDRPRPWELDVDQRRAVHVACSGTSLAVEGPPGTGVSQTLAAAAVGLAEQGRRVLVLTPRRNSATSFVNRLMAVGLGDLVLDVQDGGGDRDQALAQLSQSLDRALTRPRAGALELSSGPRYAVSTLAQGPTGSPEVLKARDILAGSAAALHEIRQPWGVSAYQAMVAWAGITGAPHPPTSPVRLDPQVLQGLDVAARERARTHLHLAAEAGVFTMTRGTSRWIDSTVRTAEAARSVLASAQRGRDAFAGANERILALAEEAQLPAPACVAEWAPLVELLTDLRDVLDVMTPAVLERPVAPLLAALGAPTGGVQVPDQSWSERRRLRKFAQSLVIPGVFVRDLPAQLSRASSVRERWAQASGGRRPVVPPGLNEARACLVEVEEALAGLAAGFAPGELERLRALDLKDLGLRLDDLATDTEGVRGQARRVALRKGLTEAGLAPLLADFQERSLPADKVDAELDLVWWSGVLEAIVNGDERLARHDGTRLREAAAHLAVGERAGLKAAVATSLDARAERVARAVAQYPHEADWVRSGAASGSRVAWQSELFGKAPHVLAALCPLIVMSPDAVARCLPGPAAPTSSAMSASPAGTEAGFDRGTTVDTVIIDDANTVGLHEAVASIARARQVIVGGDRLGPMPISTVETPVESVLDAMCQQVGVYRLHSDHRTQDGRLVELLRSRYQQRWDSVPGAWPDPDIRLDVLDEGTAVPALGEELAISADAEVRRVVELVAEHAALRSNESLVVITLGDRHAERIEGALRVATRSRAILARWLQDQARPGVREPFCVRSAARVQGLERDSAILTIGLARTPHGRMLHRFGMVDSPAGAGQLVSALSRARIRTTIVSCFGPDDLQAHRLRSEGARLLLDAMTVAREARQSPRAPVEPDALVSDLAVRLRAEGIPVHWGVGGQPWPVDLALSDPQQPGMMLVAVDLDGPLYAARGLRERDHQRGRRWRKAGWVHLRVSAMSVFTDPAAEVARIKDAWLGAMLAREREIVVSERELAARAARRRATYSPVTTTSTLGGTASMPAPVQEAQSAPEAGPQAGPAPQAVEVPVSADLLNDGPVLAEQTGDDTDAGWGEASSRSADDERFLRERPPHW